METLLAHYRNESCCAGSTKDLAIKTAPFVALSVLGGPIAPALGGVSLVATQLLPEYKDRRDVKHMQLHLAYGLVAAAGLTFLTRTPSAHSLAELITRGGTWGIVAVFLKRNLDATQPPAPASTPPANLTGPTKTVIINGVPTQVPDTSRRR
jgi:hypothetical protein